MSPRDLAAHVLAISALCLVGLTVALPVSAGTKRPRVGGCNVLPASNVWNRRIDKLPVHPDSGKIKRRIGLNAPLHPDFGSFSGYGIPWNVVDADTPRSNVEFWWPDESDAGPYPIPPDPPIEGASDSHILMLDRDRCKLYELFAADYSEDERWTAGSGAIWRLGSNRLRPKGWTSADAAGLPSLPGLVRYKEVKDGAIRHALRFMAPATRRKCVDPARHFASHERDR